MKNLQKNPTSIWCGDETKVYRTRMKRETATEYAKRLMSSRNGYRVRETATEYAPCNSSLKLQKYYLYSSNFFSMLLIIMFSFSP